ncbi:MAG: hypothetical protein KDJ65_24405 [Anaerolineae bacterium]|nr:hypothetical protein [Anaerolineae bacterium]
MHDQNDTHPQSNPVEAGPQLNAKENVERIRDIIFGPQIRDYEQRFYNVQRDLERLQQELDHLAENLTDQDTDQNKKLQTLRRDMRQSDDDIRNELRQTANKLSFDKVDRVTLGELFIQLGNNLKSGDSLVDLLKSLSNSP